MEPALKQRLIGGAVLVALAVIFLPMLIKGPATESGAADVSLDMPDAPQEGMTTRTLPLGAPGAAGEGGAVGLQGEPDTLPTVDTRSAASAASSPMLPAETAGGNYAVSFGSWATDADADRVIAALRREQLTAYRESAVNRSGRSVQRVRIGPFPTEADAEAARIRAGRVRSDLGAQVVVLDTNAVPVADPRTATAGTATAPAAPIPVTPTTATPVSTPTPLASAPAPKPEPLPAAKPIAPPTVEADRPATPVAAVPSPSPAPTPKPAAASVGFAVQLGAFSKAEDAARLRDTLRGAGFNAFVESVRSDKGVLSRVRVGPVGTRAEAESLKSQVASRAGVSGDVRAHP